MTIYYLYPITVVNISIYESVKKFIGWPRYSHGMLPNEVYFSVWFPLLSTHFFHWCCSAWISLVKKVINSRYDISLWPVNFSAHPQKFHTLNVKTIKELSTNFLLFFYCKTNVAFTFYECLTSNKNQKTKSKLPMCKKMFFLTMSFFNNDGVWF